jgi:hypothetical protein
MKMHIRKDVMASSTSPNPFSTYCGLDGPRKLILESVPMTKNQLKDSSWDKCKSCSTNRIKDVEKQLEELEKELRIRKSQRNLGEI